MRNFVLKTENLNHLRIQNMNKKFIKELVENLSCYHSNFVTASSRYKPQNGVPVTYTRSYEAHISNVSFLNENLLELYRLCEIQTENPESPRL